MENSDYNLDFTIIEARIKNFINNQAHTLSSSLRLNIDDELPEKEKALAANLDLLLPENQDAEKATDITETPVILDGKILLKILNIPEHFDFIQHAYRFILNREADSLGSIYQIRLLISGFSRETILVTLINSKEFKKRGVILTLPKKIKIAAAKADRRKRIFALIKKIPVFSNIFFWCHYIFRLPEHHAQLMELQINSYSFINHQVEMINKKINMTKNNLSNQIQFIKAQMMENNNKIKNSNHDINIRFFDVLKRCDELTKKLDDSTQRSIHVSHYHFEKSQSQFEEMAQTVKQLQKELINLSREISVHDKNYI